MNELHVTLGDRRYSFDGGRTVRIGRSPDNDIVVGDPTVSRQHAQLSCGPRGWEFVNVGRALSFLNGEPVTRALLSGPARIQLSSLDGPALAITPVAAPDPELTPDRRPAWPAADEPPTPAEAEPAWPGPAGAVLPQADPVLPEADPVWPSAAAPAVPEADPAWPSAAGALPPEPDPLGPGAAGLSAAGADPGGPDPAAADPAGASPEAPGAAGGDPALPGEAVPGPDELTPAEASPAGPPVQHDATSVMASPLADPAGAAAWPGEPGLPGGHALPRARPPTAPPVDEIATALHILIPIRSWLHDPGWRQFLRLLVIPYGLLPLIFIALFASSDSLATPGWAYSLYIAPLWAIVFWLLIRPGPVGRLEWLLGAGAIAFSLVWIRLVTVNLNEVMGRPGKPLSFFGALGVGLNEEITKALPILLAALLLLRLRSVKLDVRMWMFLGAIVGLAFGVTEQAGYTLQDIQAITAAQANSEAIVEVLAFAERVFVDGFQHALWAGVSAFFIGIAVNYPRRRIQLVALGIAIPAVLHGLYDWSAGAFASLWVPIIIQALSVFLFLGYTMSAAAIEKRVRQTPMFRGESMLFERITDSGSFPRHPAPRDGGSLRREASPPGS
ncbi:MAG TPA: PrsW family glutamic-type intramembrane protease [Streptosporangiaceae bacterium]